MKIDSRFLQRLFEARLQLRSRLASAEEAGLWEGLFEGHTVQLLGDWASGDEPYTLVIDGEQVGEITAWPTPWKQTW